jgi:hypothetical protein
VFTLADGRVVTDAETGADLATSALGVLPTAALDIKAAKVMRTVEQGAQFRYVFDLGDDWTHCCTVDADRWLRVSCEGSRAGWEDMATYAAGVADSHLREQLERAIEGKGAYRRFRDLIDETGLRQAWQEFSDERQIGRARAYLAEQGIRATS